MSEDRGRTTSCSRWTAYHTNRSRQSHGATQCVINGGGLPCPWYNARVMASDIKSSLDDPNGELSEDEVATGQRTAAGPFHRCHVKPELVQGYPCRTLVLGALGGKRYLIYARVTRLEAEEQGTGPMPLVLFDAARELQAEPLVVRVNMAPFGSGIVFKYFGVDEAERLLKSNSAYQAVLLRGKTVNDFRRLLHGKINHFELQIEQVAYSRWRSAFANPRLPESERTRLEPKRHVTGWALRLVVDGEPVKTPVISLRHLVRSTFLNDGHYIFTDETGDNVDDIPAAIVVSDGNATLWKAHGLKPRRVWLFERQQYRAEVLSRVQDYLSRYKTLPSEQVFSSEYSEMTNVCVGGVEYLEQAIYEAGESDDD